MSDTDTTLPGAGTTPVEPAPTFLPGRSEPLFPATYVHELRQESAGNRIKLRAAEAQLAVSGPEALAKANATIRDLKLDAAVREATIKHGADYALTRAILKDGPVYATLDPDGKDFTTALDELVGETIARHGALKVGATSAPVRSGSDITTSGAVQKAQPTRADLAALRDGGNPEAVVELMKSGQLDQMMKVGW